MFSFLAQAPANPPQQGFGDGVTINIRDSVDQISRQTSFSATVEGYIRGLLVLSAFFTFFYMLYGAFEWITAGGEASKIEAARRKITQAVVGLVVLASTAAIFMVIQYFLGIRILGGSGSGNGGGEATAQTCAGGIAIGDEVNDGGSGNYCNVNGQPSAAMVKCVGAGEGPSGFPYPHYEPVSCVEGEPSYNW